MTDLKHGHHRTHSKYQISRPRAYYAEKFLGQQIAEFIEVLEIKDPPKDKNGFVIHYWRKGRGSTVYYFDSLDLAKAAFNQAARKINCPQILNRAQGMKIIEITQKPWFYDLFF